MAENVALRLLSKLSQMKSSKMIVILAVGFVIVCVPLFSVMYSVKPGHVGIIFSKFGKQSQVPGRFIVEKGEKGYRREVLLPGWHFFWMAEPMWKYKITQAPMVSIKPQTVGLIEALDGNPMPKGSILAKDDYTDKNGVFHMGEKGPRKTVLRPGYHPINPKYLKVTQKNAVIIPKGMIGVDIRRTGEMPPPGTVLVDKDSNYRGIQREIRPPGTYYINSLEVEVEKFKATVILKGQVGIVTKRVGEMPPSGTILVSKDDNYQGIQREVLQPGMYYINPYERDVKLQDAVIVSDGFVGVQIAKTGKPKPTGQLLAKPGERGIRRDILSPGIYYVNPYEYEVIVFDTREQRYEMTSQKNRGDTKGDDAIHFLSDDGFMITFDLTVLYQVKGENTPYIVANVGRDIQTVRDVKIRPAARSFARIIGSKNRGEEFIHGITREKFQKDLHEAIKAKCMDSEIIINQTLVRHFEVPSELRDPITKKVIAFKVEEQYKQEQDTQKANAELSRQKQLVIFESEKVKAETDKARAVIAAEQRRDEAEILMAMKKFQAEGDAAKKIINADAVLYAAQKEAEGIEARLLAEAKGQKKMVEAWSGEGAQFIVASKLAEILNGANIIPLETLFGGGAAGGKGDGETIRYHNTVDLLNFFNINKMLDEKPEQK